MSDPGRRRCDPALFGFGHPVLGICYGMQLMTHQLGGPVAPAPQREFGHAQVSVTAKGAPAVLFADVPVRASRLGEPRRFRRRGPGGFLGRRHERERAGRGDGRHPARSSTRCCSIPRSCTRSTGSRFCATSRSASAAAPATGRWRRLSRRRPRAFATQVGDGARRLRAVRRRRFDGGRGADPPGDRRPADLHLRGQRRAAAGRGRRRSGGASSACSCRWCSSTRRALFLDRLAGVTDPEKKRKIIGATFIDVFEARGDRSSARSTSWRRARCIRTSSSPCRSSGRRR